MIATTASTPATTSPTITHAKLNGQPGGKARGRRAEDDLDARSGVRVRGLRAYADEPRAHDAGRHDGVAAALADDPQLPHAHRRTADAQDPAVRDHVRAAAPAGEAHDRGAAGAG